VLTARKEVEFVYLYFAAHLLGIVNVVIDPSSPDDRLDYINSIVQPVALFGISGSGRCISYSDIDLSWEGGELQDLPTVDSSSVADVMFTTGTTGAPKGVCLSHDNIAGSAANINGFIGTGSSDIEALGLPLSHSFGLGRLRCVFRAGATMILVGNFANLKAFFTVMENEHVTGFGMVPAVWQYIKRLSGRRIGKFADQLRYIEVGSAALPIEDKRLLMELFPTTRLCVHYGLTEASRALFTELHADADCLTTIGRPVSSWVEVCIMDEDGNPMPNGEDGELCVKGNMVTHSYFLQRDNQEAFFDDWFRTGDWGHRDSDGRFYLTGRKKELINVGGEKVSPATIEEAIRSLGVADCACVAIPDPNGILGEVPKAFLLNNGGKQPAIEDIKRQLALLLPAHEIPAEWEWIDQIPRSASGKIQRLKLKH
jgi:long-chain acyl-CoA synthetase